MGPGPARAWAPGCQFQVTRDNATTGTQGAWRGRAQGWAQGWGLGLLFQDKVTRRPLFLPKPR